MRRGRAFVLALALVAGAGAPVAAAKKKPAATKGSGGGGGSLWGGRALHVRAIDLRQRSISIELVAFAKIPAANLFSLTDERGRHAVAQTMTCEEPVDGVRSCALEIPAGYERHRIVDVLVRIGSLKGRQMHAPPIEVQAAWDAATGAGEKAATPSAPSAPSGEDER